MYLLYVDEAGTSRPEPHSIYAGVLVKASKWRAVEREMERVFDLHVPASVRRGFIFHGKEVFNGGRTVDRSVWPLEDRLAFFTDFVSIPRRLNCPIAIGKQCRNAEVPLPPNIDCTALEFQNVMTLLGCLREADKCVRYFSPPGQICVAVAEDNPPMRQLVTRAFLSLRHSSELLRLGPEHTMNGQSITFSGQSFVDMIHFAPKHGAPLLQLADACAFAMRRFLAVQPHGERLFLSMTGMLKVDQHDFLMWREAPGSSCSYQQQTIVRYSAKTSWQQS